MADEDPVSTGGRILLVMAGIGVGMGVTAVFTGQWLGATVVPELGAAEEEVVTSYTPLAFLSIAALGAPLVAGILGVFEGGSADTRRGVAVVGLACLVGAVVMVSLAGVGVALSEPPADSVDDETTGASPGLFELVGLGGLCGVGALVSGATTARFAGG